MLVIPNCKMVPESQYGITCSTHFIPMLRILKRYLTYWLQARTCPRQNPLNRNYSQQLNCFILQSSLLALASLAFYSVICSIPDLFIYLWDLTVTYEIIGNKVKRQISKQVFQENTARQIFRKTNIS